MVEINESILLTVAGMVFIPIFIFLIKMIIEQGNTKAHLDKFDQHVTDTKNFPTAIELLKEKIRQIESDIKDLFRRTNQNNNGSRK